MSVKQQLVADFLRFLDQSIEKGDVPSDERESVELAISTLRDSFAIPEGMGSDNLLEVYTAASSSKASTSRSTSEKTVDTASKEPSEEDKAEAEKLKMDGNRLMAHKQYSEAVDAYSQAIAKNPTNALYFSNRAAAYSQQKKYVEAVDDARTAVKLDPSYSKAYSRLGLALWSIGDLKGSLEAYENGLKAEGDHPTEAMQRDYATVKKKYEEELSRGSFEETQSGDSGKSEMSEKVSNPWEKSTDKSVDTSSSASSEGASTGTGTGAGGFPGMGGLASLMQNPELQRMAQQMMSSNPGMLNDVMNSSAAQRVRESFQQGQMPSLSEMMQDESIQNLMRSFKQ